jgi:PPOX class probable F420-dependent enzyme
MPELPQLARDLLDGKNFASVATVQADGSPQSSLVWVKRDGDDVLFSTIRGRQKTTNMLADARVSVLVSDVADPNRYAEIRGQADITDDPPAALIHELSWKYDGHAFDLPPGQQRVIVRVRPTHVVVVAD